MKYGLDDKLPPAALLLYGLQWWVVTLPSVVIMGLVVARLHGAELPAQILSMQKLFALTGAVTVIQVLIGHRLPLVVGPASTLLVGLVASRGIGPDATFTALGVGGLILGLTAATGLLGRLRFFFTPRIIAVILILIAFTLMPTILGLVLGSGGHGGFGGGKNGPSFDLLFALALVFGLLLCNRVLSGVWKSLTVIIGLAGGSLAYYFFLGFPAPLSLPAATTASGLALTTPDFDFGVILAFLFCFLALAINELGSIEALGHMLRVNDMGGRIKKGVGIQGAANMAAGGLGIIGSVDYSMSAGVIAATGCASRYALVPAGLGVFACAFFPGAILLLSAIPGTVMGALLFYLMATQLASGLGMLAAERGVHNFESALTVALPLMTGIFIGFAPPGSFAGFPDLLRPIIANGFVMGAVTVIILEHGIFRQNRAAGLPDQESAHTRK